VAAVAARFHRSGYNHRDLYCCHFFIKETATGVFQVNLIDLQRVEHRRYLRWRWLVKDLAQLAYSAPRDRVTCTQKMAFIKQYLGVKKLRPQDKRLIRRVLAKQRSMERNLGAHP
jgi:heptose I phosphotransferase